jgi:hypothetical protein
LIFEVKELADSEVRIRVRTSHKAIADQADIQFLHWNEKEFEELQESRSIAHGVHGAPGDVGVSFLPTVRLSHGNHGPQN